jgi:hypothetical protein
MCSQTRAQLLTGAAYPKSGTLLVNSALLLPAHEPDPGCLPTRAAWLAADLLGSPQLMEGRRLWRLPWPLKPPAGVDAAALRQRVRIALHPPACRRLGFHPQKCVAAAHPTEGRGLQERPVWQMAQWLCNGIRERPDAHAGCPARTLLAGDQRRAAQQGAHETMQ